MSDSLLDYDHDIHLCPMHSVERTSIMTAPSNETIFIEMKPLSQNDEGMPRGTMRFALIMVIILCAILDVTTGTKSPSITKPYAKPSTLLLSKRVAEPSFLHRRVPTGERVPVNAHVGSKPTDNALKKSASLGLKSSIRRPLAAPNAR